MVVMFTRAAPHVPSRLGTDLATSTFMRLQDIMTTKVRSIPPELDTAAARHTMRSANCRHLVVVDGERIVGVLSQRDLGGTRQEMLPAGRVVDLMSSHVVVAAPETSIRTAANLLRGHNIGCLPVVDGKKLVGIVTTSDLLALIGETDTATKKSRRPKKR
jgi:acetoin utilization protein AcuB